LNWMNMNTQISKSKDGDIRVQKIGGMNAGITAAIQALAQWKSVAANEQPDQSIDSW